MSLNSSFWSEQQSKTWKYSADKRQRKGADPRNFKQRECFNVGLKYDYQNSCRSFFCRWDNRLID